MYYEWHVETHVGNPSMARVVGPKFRQMPECEGGGWYTDAETARAIVAGQDALARLKAIVDAFDGGHLQMASEEIPGEPGTGFDDHNGPSPGYPPHPWHEEWLVYARQAVAKATPPTTE